MDQNTKELALEFGKVTLQRFMEQSEMMAKTIALGQKSDQLVESEDYMIFSLIVNLQHFNEVELAAMAAVFLHKYAKLKMELDNDKSQA
jgi:hypothetical protein